MHGEKSTLYDALGLARNATPSDIARVYRRISKEMQSDAAVPDPQRMALVHEAYEVLSDPRKRAAYDRSIRGASFHGDKRGDKPNRWWWLLVPAIAAGLGALYYFTLGRAPEAQRQGPALSLQEVQTAASVSVGRVNRIEMSGARSHLGVAVAVEEGVMLAPCQGIDPGVQIVVRIPPRDIPAQLRQIDATRGLCELAVTGGGSWPLPKTAVVPRVGDKMYAAHLNALGEVVISTAEVRRVTRGAQGSIIEITPPPAAPPLEGSPLLDVEGRIAAIALKGQLTTLPATSVVDAPLRNAAPPAVPKVP